MNEYRIDKQSLGRVWDFVALVKAPSRRKAIRAFWGTKGCPNEHRVRLAK